jgi:hypothetical protein
MTYRCHIVSYGQALADVGYVGNVTLFVKTEDIHVLNREANAMLRYSGMKAYTINDAKDCEPLNRPITYETPCGAITVREDRDTVLRRIAKLEARLAEERKLLEPIYE